MVLTGTYEQTGGLTGTIGSRMLRWFMIRARGSYRNKELVIAPNAIRTRFLWWSNISLPAAQAWQELENQQTRCRNNRQTVSRQKGRKRTSVAVIRTSGA